MSAESFVRDRTPGWDRLEAIVSEVGRKGARRTEPEKLDELLRLYRVASADLARLRSLEADPATVRRINRLVGRAHAQIYRAPRVSVPVGSFFLTIFPRAFRKTWRFSLASFVIAALFGLMAYHAVGDHPDVVADILGGGTAEFRDAHRPGEFAERFQKTPSPLLSSFVTTNNIRVALTAFALGVTFGIGTVYVLVVNGTMLGGFAGAYAKDGLEHEFWLAILPHGALELSAIVVAGGAGLHVGYHLWCPGRRSRIAALRQSAVVAVQLAVGLIPAFVIAGLFEGFVTPSNALGATAKGALGVLAAVAFWIYLWVVGRRPQAHAKVASGVHQA